MKMTKHELLKRLDNEFNDVDFQVEESATKGVVYTVHFYEDNLKEHLIKVLEENEDDS